MRALETSLREALLSLKPSVQDTLSTFFGDYWLGRTEPLPSAALISLLADFDVTEQGGRAALARLVDLGVVNFHRQGRTTQYFVTRWGIEAQYRAVDVAMEFGLGSRPWDGQWTVMIFTMPEGRASDRNGLRRQIRSIGFAPLFAGVWVSPRVSADEAWEVLTMRKAMLATVLRTPNPRFGRPMTEAWSSTVIDEMYTGFIDSFSPFADIGDREVAPADALVLRTSLMNAWRLFKEQDPDLPQAMGLGSSLRVEARQLFVSLYDRLAPGAEQRVRQAVAAAELEAGTNHSSLVASYTVEARLEELERLRRAGSRLS